MKHSIPSKVLTLCMAAALLLAVAAPAMADDYYTPVKLSTYPVTYDVYLIMDKDVAPPVDPIHVNGRQADPVPGSSTTQPILKGPFSSGGYVPTFETATEFFSSNTEVITSAAGQGSDVLNETIDYATQKYAKITYTLNPYDVEFPKPGIYRYNVEQGLGLLPPSKFNVSEDPKGTMRNMDIYVSNSETNPGQLVISSVSIHTPDDPNTKTTGYTSVYTSNVLTVNKTVAGNQGNRDEYFKFTISVDTTNHWQNTAEEDCFYVSVSPGSFGPSTATPTEANLNETTLKVGNLNYAGPATGTYYIKHGQTITVRGMNSATEYIVTEYPNASEGYTTSYTIDGGAVKTDTTTGKVAIVDTDDAVVFTNSREGTVPTGILMDVWPYLLMVGVAAAALVLLCRKRKATQE